MLPLISPSKISSKQLRRKHSIKRYSSLPFPCPISHETSISHSHLSRFAIKKTSLFLSFLFQLLQFANNWRITPTLRQLKWYNFTLVPFPHHSEKHTHENSQQRFTIPISPFSRNQQEYPHPILPSPCDRNGSNFNFAAIPKNHPHHHHSDKHVATP